MLRRITIASAVIAVGAISTGHVLADGHATKGALVLQGRWAGEGTLKPQGGPQETFKCIATYFPSRQGHEVKQNLRCHSDNYKFDIASLLEIDGEKVSGTWQEKSYAFDGAIDGVVKNNRYAMKLTGDFFQADMTIEGTACQQQVVVTPAPDTQIEYMTASLRKC